MPGNRHNHFQSRLEGGEAVEARRVRAEELVNSPVEVRFQMVRSGELLNQWKVISWVEFRIVVGSSKKILPKCQVKLSQQISNLEVGHSHGREEVPQFFERIGPFPVVDLFTRLELDTSPNGGGSSISRGRGTVPTFDNPCPKRFNIIGKLPIEFSYRNRNQIVVSCLSQPQPSQGFGFG